ncbi:glycine betaine ABC transporter substrate-binding protein [Mycolicibacterium sp. 624]|uniref:glycine betaine ABC transporter substrate-binding protein n=1 Tax=Mycolicibacterium sp. 624 TaxID=3156314 RepID=UPI003390D4A1
MRRLAVALVALLLAGCGGEASAPSVAVGTAEDSESALLGQLYAAALRYYGSPAHVETSPDPVADLDTGDVLVVPGLTGRLLARFDPGSTARAPEQVYRSMISSLPEGVGAGDYAQSAGDEPAVAITEATERAWGGHDVTALVRNCDGLTVGSLKGAVTPRSVGSCTLAAPRQFGDSAALFASLRAGGIDVAWTSTAAPDVPDEVVVLADRTALIRAENVVPLYRRNELTERQVLALNQIAGELDTGSLADMLRKLDEGAEPGAVAAEWLASHPLGH